MQAKNLPTITSRYWTAILVASMAGANTGDFLANILHLGHLRGLPPLAAAFVVIVWAERRAQAATEAYYWLAIIVLRTGATNLADLVAHDLQLGYGLIDTGLTALLIAILLADRARGGATGAGGQAAGGQAGGGRNLPATDAPYWAAMLTAGTLGTATGDFVAAHLGFGFGSLVLAPVYAIVLLLAARLGGMTKPWYWASIVAARTAGTTLGDFVANQNFLPLGLSRSTVLTCGLLAAIVFFWRDAAHDT